MADVLLKMKGGESKNSFKNSSLAANHALTRVADLLSLSRQLASIGEE
jgi:hypothetical protein